MFTCFGTGFLFNDCEGVCGQLGFADLLPGTYDFTGGVANGGTDRVPAVVDVLGKVAQLVSHLLTITLTFTFVALKVWPYGRQNRQK